MQIVAPAPGSVFVRDVLGTTGALVASVQFRVEAAGPVSRVTFELAKSDDRPGEQVLGEAGADMALYAELMSEGSVTVMARAYDEAGTPVASDSVTLLIEPPNAADCYDWLDLYGIEYTTGPIRNGVAEPVTVTVPINGVGYRRSWDDDYREQFFMDCSMALSLARAAHHLRARDVIEVRDMGVYNYRCVGNEGTPPDCPRGMSQHAFAKGIDIAGLATGDGTYYSVEDDWQIDLPGEATCEAETEAGKDRFMHELICDLKADRVWNIILTPNYNSAHRNHFHVDLTTGEDFIKSATAVDSGPDHH
ncbi:MAG: extensin family protein [Myxococcota bacterium]